MLLLERGTFLPQEKPNWNTTDVFLDNRYHTKDVWTDKARQRPAPGNRLLGGRQHQGIWRSDVPLTGRRLRRAASQARDFAGVAGEIRCLRTLLHSGGKAVLCARKAGHRSNGTTPQRTLSATPPSPTSRACRRFRRSPGLGTQAVSVSPGAEAERSDRVESKCIRCDTCDGYPCLLHAKSDSDINCIRAIMHLPNVTLLTQAKVTRLLTNVTGTAVDSVEVELDGSGKKTTVRRRHRGCVLWRHQFGRVAAIKRQ